jgi:hypothetical protein
MRVFQKRPLVALVIGTLLLSSLPALAQQPAPPPSSPPPQESGKSLADVVKDAKKSKAARAAKVITEEDINKGPLPRLSMDEVDNSDEILEAIGAFESKHTKEETEQAIHSWYSEYDEMLAAAIRESNRTNERRADSNYNGYWICQTSPSYENCVTRRQAEMRGAHDDMATLKDNSAVTARVQQSFAKIRMGILRYNLTYSWFKIRNGNGIGSY